MSNSVVSLGLNELETRKLLNESTPVATLQGDRQVGKLSHLRWQSFHALLIGIDNYKSISGLSGAVRDLESVKAFLQDAFAVPEGSTLDIRTLTNEDATSAAITNAIAALGADQSIQQDDAILIYYAGHGGSMPPPEGWPGWSPEPPSTKGWSEDVDIQCIVAHDAVASQIAPDREELYAVTGVVPDRTLNVLLRELADAKGNNITVILDCCHSGSGTRAPASGERIRGVDFRDPNGTRVTIRGDYDKKIWGRMFKRGAVLDWEYRHAGLGSHVLLAACGLKEYASDARSFTKVLVPFLEQKYLDALSYAVLIKSLPPVGNPHSQHPLCEGNNASSMLFDLRDIQLGRPAFDIITDKGVPMLSAGKMLGIEPGTKLSVYTSKATSLREELVGTYEADRVFATSATLKNFPVDKLDLHTLIASPTTELGPPLPVYIAESSIRDAVQKAIDEESPEDRYGRPRIEASGTIDTAKLIVSTSGENSVVFRYQPSSSIARFGLNSLQYTLPVDYSRIRRVLRASTHFFQFLGSDPGDTGVRLRDMVDVRVHRLKETNENALINGKIVRVLDAEERLVANAEGAYEVLAAKGNEDLESAPRYGVELVNRFEVDGLYAWMFFFDCSTLEILPYHEPRIAKRDAAVDPTLPCVGTNLEPVPVALNYRNGPGKVIKFQLDEGSSRGVAFLRVFLSTRYRGGGLSSIAQAKPLAFEKGSWRGLKSKGPARSSIGGPLDAGVEATADLWDAITIPLIFCARSE